MRAELWRQEPLVAGVVVVLPALVALDRPFSELASPSPVGDIVLNVARFYGERWTPVALATGFYLVGWILDDTLIRRTGITIGGATLLTAIAVTGIKIGVGRVRPAVNPNSLVLRPLGWQDAHQSFPSGHAAVAFMLSASLVQSLELPPVVAAALYGTATTTALTRLYRRRHWFSDVVAGALIGYIAGRAVADALHRKQQRAGRWELVPVAGGVGVCVYR
ncbi:MAG: phosphatase PAP2 family protein [Bacteroidota bacterium]|nr:phosphatase PAP2 family protein [Bacteroidota bacterium]